MFIRAKDGREIFFHKSGLQGVDFNDLFEGDTMEFDIEKDRRGHRPRGVNVRRAPG